MTENQNPLVVTLWETYGSNMDAVAAELARRTGMKVHQQAYSSDEIEEAQATREAKGRIGQLLMALTPVFGGEEGDPSRTMQQTEAGYRKLADDNTVVVEDEAREGGILLGRNGQFILSTRPNTVHVKLDGPVALRVANAAQLSGISADRAAKRQSIEDGFRSDMSMRTYRFDPRDNGYYDAVINSAGMPVEKAVDIIEAVIKAKTN